MSETVQDHHKGRWRTVSRCGAAMQHSQVGGAKTCLPGDSRVSQRRPCPHHRGVPVDASKGPGIHSRGTVREFR